MKNKITTKRFYTLFRRIVTPIILLELFFKISIEKAQAETESGFEKFNVDLNYFLTGNKGGTITKMADANLDKIPAVIGRVITYVVSLGGVIAFIMILYSSVMYATSFGDESRAETAKKALTWAIIGIVVVTLYAVIMRIINMTFNMGL